MECHTDEPNSIVSGGCQQPWHLGVVTLAPGEAVDNMTNEDKND